MRILHVGVGNLGAGGVATYVQSVLDAQRLQGHEVMLSEIWTGPQTLPTVQAHLDRIEEIEDLSRSFRADVVHLHSQLTHYGTLGRACVITAHEHTSHCPAGSRYLEARRRICDRDFGLLNCLYGHYVDRCGSRNLSNLRRRMGITTASASFQGHWIAPATFTRDWLRRRGLRDDRIHLVHNPGPRPCTSPAPLPSDTRNILFLGRLVGNKGVDVLLDAMIHLPGTSLSVLGDGPDRLSLEQKSQQLGLADRVRFTGWADATAVEAACKEANVLAIPSLWPEPFGLVALEAARDHLPVVASKVGGLVDVIADGRTGVLVPPNDPASLAAGLDRILSDPLLARRMGEQAALRSARRFSMELHLRRLDRVYAQAASKGAPP